MVRLVTSTLCKFGHKWIWIDLSVDVVICLSLTDSSNLSLVQVYSISSFMCTLFEHAFLLFF